MHFSKMTDAFDLSEASDEFLAAPTRLTIDLTAVANNWRDMAKRSGKARAAAVVKADAYGLGIEDCRPHALSRRRTRFLRGGTG